MVCPYCNNEMKKGKIHGMGSDMAWLPEGVAPKGMFAGKRWSENGISLSGWSPWKTPHVQAFYCERCNKLIVNLDGIQ